MDEFTEQEAYDFLLALFPGGLRAPDLLTSLCPDGWSHSPLRHCFHPTPEQRYAEHLHYADYLRFYMGTWSIDRRADLTPVYELIFKRIQALGATWQFSFPRLQIIDFGTPPSDDRPEDYDPSAALQREEELQKRRAETNQLRADLDRSTLAAQRAARSAPPPATVTAFATVFGHFPAGWPPDPYSLD